MNFELSLFNHSIFSNIILMQLRARRKLSERRLVNRVRRNGHRQTVKQERPTAKGYDFSESVQRPEPATENTGHPARYVYSWTRPLRDAGLLGDFTENRWVLFLSYGELRLIFHDKTVVVKKECLPNKSQNVVLALLLSLYHIKFPNIVRDVQCDFARGVMRIIKCQKTTKPTTRHNY